MNKISKRPQFFNFSFNGKRRLHIFNIKNKNKSVFFVLHF